MNELERLQLEMRIGTRLLFRELNDPWGHIALRLPAGDNRDGFMLKHVRVQAPPSDPEEIMVFDYDGHLLEGRRSIPWELPLYVHTFRQRPDAQSVIHMHPQVATAITMAGKTIFAVSQQTTQFEYGVPVIPGEMINTDALGAELAGALGDWPALLLKGHGAVTVGSSVPHAVQNMLCVEQAARQQVWAATVGTPEVMPDHILAFFRRPPADQEATALWLTKLYSDRAALGVPDEYLERAPGGL